MSYLLRTLTTKREVDSIIRDTIDKVLILRFGRCSDSVCLLLDDIVCYQFPEFCFHLPWLICFFRIYDFVFLMFHSFDDLACKVRSRSVEVFFDSTGWYWFRRNTGLHQVLWHNSYTVHCFLLQCSSYEDGFRVSFILLVLVNLLLDFCSNMFSMDM